MTESLASMKKRDYNMVLFRGLQNARTREVSEARKQTMASTMLIQPTFTECLLEEQYSLPQAMGTGKHGPYQRCYQKDSC